MHNAVNLLDTSKEPSDEDLSSLMKEVVVDARAKAMKTHRDLMATISRQAHEAAESLFATEAAVQREGCTS